MPYWGRMAGFGSAPQQPQQGGIMGFNKPTGVPHIITPNPMGIIFYAFDTGTGIYSIPQDCFPGHTFDPPYFINGSPPPFGTPNYDTGSGGQPWDPQTPAAVPTSSGTGDPYGMASHWIGTFQEPGAGALIGGNHFPDNDAMRDAVNLNSKPAGAAFTMFATFMMTSYMPSSLGLIAGRASLPDNNWFQGAITLLAPGQVGFSWSTANRNQLSFDDHQHLFMPGNATLNTIHTAVATCVNLSAGGNATVSLYLDGVLVNTQTGTNLSDVSYSNSSQEDQWQVGATFHVSGPGQSDLSIIGSVYQAGEGTQFWSATDVANFTANPYQFLSL